jgi:hypothetical protein
VRLRLCLPPRELKVPWTGTAGAEWLSEDGRDEELSTVASEMLSARWPSRKRMKQPGRKSDRLTSLVNSVLLGSVATALTVFFSSLTAANLPIPVAVLFGGTIGSVISLRVFRKERK